MRAAEKRIDEAAALAALDALQVLDSAPDPEFDAIARAAALLCGVPIALVSLIDADRQWLKAQVGEVFSGQTPRDLAFCAHTVLGDELLVVQDATQDERFVDHPFVTGAPNIRFYAGAPLVVSGGHRVGALCLIDQQPRQLTSVQREALQCLAVVAASALEGRRSRLLAEHAAREAARAVLVQEHSADAIVGLAADFTIVRWNPAAERLFGHPAEAVVGRPIQAFVRPVDLPAHCKAVARMAEGQALSADSVFCHRDGGDIALAVTLVPELDQQGALLGATLFARDDRPHQRALATVAASELHMRHLYESTPALLHAIDLEGRLTMVSDAWLARLGYAREAVLGRRIIEFLIPTSREYKQTIALPVLMREGRYDGLEIRMCCRSGEVIDVLLSAIVEYDPAGRPLRVLAGLEDITARLQAERELRDSEAQATATFEQAAVGMFHQSLDMRLLRVNRTLCAMLGYSRDELLALRTADVVHPEDFAAAKAPFLGLIRGETDHYAIDGRNRCKDGRYLWTRLTSSVVRDPQGRALYLIGVLEDISERRAADTALARSQTRLEETGRIAGIGGWRFDLATGVFSSPDEATARIYEAPAGSAVTADSALSFYAPASQQQLRDAAIECLVSGKAFDLELPFTTARGRPGWVRLVGAVERRDGQVVGLVGALQDISARRKVENELVDARQRELKVGAQIQQALLVTAAPPAMDGLQFASHSQASQGIDGDFVEIVRVGEHCVDLITGDVMGKGLGAAMLGAATKLQFSRSIAELVTQVAAGQPLPGPAQVVAAVHRAMTPTLQQLEAFVTLCYLRIDTLHDTVTWAGCGHEETLLLQAGSPPFALANQHPPLGVLDAADYVQDVRPLGPGDALFLCSDGVTDALRPDGERVGRERLVAALAERQSRHATPAAALHSLRRDLLPTGTRLVDDLTMVVVQREPMRASQGRIELPLELRALRQVRGFVASQAAAAGLDEGQAGLLELASVEAFTNVVRHGASLLEQAPMELLARRTAA